MALPKLIEDRREDPAFKLAVLYTIGFFAFLMRLTFVAIPVENKEMVNQIIPILGVIQAGIVQYFYQKSQQLQQEKKDDTIKQLANTANTTANTAATLTGTPIAPLGTPGNIPPIVETINVTAETANVTEKK